MDQRAARKLSAEAENVEILFEVTLNELGKCTYILYVHACAGVCVFYIYTAYCMLGRYFGMYAVCLYVNYVRFCLICLLKIKMNNK